MYQKLAHIFSLLATPVTEFINIGQAAEAGYSVRSTHFTFKRYPASISKTFFLVVWLKYSLKINLDLESKPPKRPLTPVLEKLTQNLFLRGNFPSSIKNYILNFHRTTLLL